MDIAEAYIQIVIVSIEHFIDSQQSDRFHFQQNIRIVGIGHFQHRRTEHTGTGQKSGSIQHVVDHLVHIGQFGPQRISEQIAHFDEQIRADSVP